MLAAVIPERVRRLIMLEGLGPFSREEKAVVRSLRARCFKYVLLKKIIGILIFFFYILKFFLELLRRSLLQDCTHRIFF